MVMYRVTFFKKGDISGEKDKYLGSVDIDDSGTKEYTLIAKAFRVANNICLLADLVKLERL